ncbi:hypothetical protein GN956_G8986 [Arapaima gigas]
MWLKTAINHLARASARARGLAGTGIDGRAPAVRLTLFQADRQRAPSRRAAFYKDTETDVKQKEEASVGAATSRRIGTASSTSASAASYKPQL